MESISWLISYLLSSIGLTVLIVWPESGPTAWLREHVVRVLLPAGTSKGSGLLYLLWLLGGFVALSYLVVYVPSILVLVLDRLSYGARNILDVFE